MPGPDAAPADHAEIGCRALEREGDVAARGRIDERLSRHAVRRTRVLFVTRQHDGDRARHPAHPPHAVHAAQPRITRLPPFMSETPLPNAFASFAPERFRLQDRVDVTDQQDTLATRAAAFRQQVSRTMHLRRQLEPVRVEAERSELARIDRAGLAHTVQVLGRARHVDGFREHVDRARHACFGGGRDSRSPRRSEPRRPYVPRAGDRRRRRLPAW